MKFQISGFRPYEKSSSICAAKWRKRGVKRSETEREEIKWIFHFIVDNLVDKQITERAESNQEIILSRQLLMTGAIITSYMVLFNSCTVPTWGTLTVFPRQYYEVPGPPLHQPGY